MKLLRRRVPHKQVRHWKPSWCIVCSASVLNQPGKYGMKRQTTSYRCEFHANICLPTEFSCFRIYHIDEDLKQTPRNLRAYNKKSKYIFTNYSAGIGAAIEHKGAREQTVNNGMKVGVDQNYEVSAGNQSSGRPSVSSKRKFKDVIQTVEDSNEPNSRHL